jgi:hypothetical protein
LKKYSVEIQAFIAANVEGRTCKELTELTNNQFGTDFTVGRMKNFKKNHNLKSNTKGGTPIGESKLFSREIDEFLKANAPGKGNKELTALVNKKFGTTYKESQIKSYKKNHHISSGLDGRFLPGSVPLNKGKKMPEAVYKKCKNTMFKKGNIPANHRPIGSERIDAKDGYRQIKVAEPNVWKLKHVVLWERHNGPAPKGYNVIFLDNNKENITLENLALISRSENLVLNHSKLRSDYPELTKVGITVAKVKCAIRKNKKENRTVTTR